jgi:hypothetical protein
MRAFIAVLFAILVSSPFAYASAPKEAANETVKNGGYISIGYVSGALAARAALNDILSLEGTFRFRSGDDEDNFAAGGRALYILKRYSSFDIYAFGGVEIGYTNSGGNGDSSTVFGSKVGTGVEYFLARNLSLSAEMGVSAVFEDSWHVVSTFSDWLSVIGFRYYLD